VPVLAASAAFAVGEGRRWTVGLSRAPGEAVAFYLTIAAATAVGAALNITPLDPMRALYWSAVINGVVAVPLMVLLMLMTAQRRVMGEFAIKGWLRALGWASTAVMGACVGAMMVGWVV
jgi:Mn2+/Fe2+ NRAMP family transporter